MDFSYSDLKLKYRSLQNKLLKWENGEMVQSIETSYQKQLDAKDRTIDNLQNEIESLKKKNKKLKEKDEKIIQKKEDEIIALRTDASYIRCEGRTGYISSVTNGDSVLYTFTPSKGHALVQGTPVEHYERVLIHDHDKTYYNYGKEHQECLVHNLRYLKGASETSPEHEWCREMHDLLQKEIHERNVQMAENPKPEPDLERVKKVEEDYDRILKKGDKELKGLDKTYHRDEINLHKRLREYKDNNLYFLRHPEIPPHNNCCEKTLREIKRKSRQVENFRSQEGAQTQAAVSTVLQTAVMKGENPYLKTVNIFKKPRPKKEKKMH